MSRILFFTSLLMVLSGSARAEDGKIFQRVMDSNTIRCGYSLWQPLLFVDPNSGEIKGIFHDLMEEAGRRLNLKIEWAEELGWGTVVESVRTGRVDMACAGYWLHPGRIKMVSYNAPQIYTPLYAWGRADEKRTFEKIEDFNDPSLTIVQIDGGSSQQVVARYLPDVKEMSLPESATNGDAIASLLTGKADFMIDDVTSFQAYDRASPGELKILYDREPFATFPAVMLLPPGEPRLKEIIDGVLMLIELDGTLDAILRRYNADQVFLRNAPPAKQ